MFYDIDGNTITTEEWSALRWETTGVVSDYARIGWDEVNGIRISTVWLGMDHSFGGSAPELFETMVFGGEWDQELTRYATKEEASKGHQRIVQRVRDGLPPFD